MHSRRITALVALFLVVTGAGAGAQLSNADSLTPFVREWRVVLTGKEAARMNWAMAGSTLDAEPIDTNELIAIEQPLLAILAAELKDAGSTAQPCDYYRQYASGRWKNYHIVLIKGFHQDYFKLPFDTAADRNQWKHEAIDPNDGGTAFWDAVYVVELHTFTQIKTRGGSHIVAFHGEA